MAALIRIGNSQGIRIPKAIIEQAKLEGYEIDLVVTDEGLLLKPRHKAQRKAWHEEIERIAASEPELLAKDVDSDMLDDSDLDTWEW